MGTFYQKQNQPQKQASSTVAPSNASASEPNPLTQPILDLQRTIGNQAVSRMQTDAKAGESLPTKARIIELGAGRHQYDFGRPITREQAAQLIFVNGNVPDEARLVQGPGDNSWTLQTFDLEGQQATVNKMRARTETVSPGKPIEPTVPGQWNPPPSREITVEWTDGPSKPSTGPKAGRHLKNDLGFVITKNYVLDEGQSPVRHVKSGFGIGRGHGYELLFKQEVSSDQVMDTLFGKNDLGEGTVKLFPVPSQPTTKWQVHVIGVDALTAFKRPVFRAFADANAEPESIAPDVPSGIRTHIENKTVPTDSVQHPPNVFVWEQEGYLVRVETDGKGKNGYYTYETTKIDHSDKASKITMRYFMMEQGMRPREAWQAYIEHWDEIHLTMLGTISLHWMRWRFPRLGRVPIARPPKPPRQLPHEPVPPAAAPHPPAPARQTSQSPVGGKPVEPIGPKSAKERISIAKPEKEPIETGTDTVSAKDKQKQRQDAANKRRQAREEAEAEERYAEEERADKGKDKDKERSKDRRGTQTASAPQASDPAFQQRVDAAVKQDLNRTGRYSGLETWKLESFTGPDKFDTPDSQLKPGRGVRYYATYRTSDGRTIVVSVNYDPIDNHFGTIKESSGKPKK